MGANTSQIHKTIKKNNNNKIKNKIKKGEVPFNAGVKHFKGIIASLES